MYVFNKTVNIKEIVKQFTFMFVNQQTSLYRINKLTQFTTEGCNIAYSPSGRPTHNRQSI